MMRIKKNDKVAVVSGKDRGKEGVVIALLPKRGKVKVKGVGIVTRHVKARRQGETAGIKKEESFIFVSKVMPICPACKRACRVNTKELENSVKVRTCGRCKEVM